jgi:Glyoxalase-like domain
MAELDHVFVCSDRGAPEAAALSGLGLTEGSPNTHPGQGTASRRFFFENAYLELIWVDDADEAQSDEVRPTRLWDRWFGRRSSACPFGVILRPSSSAESHSAPFPSWTYRPRYLPPGLGIEVACDTPISEPELFYIALARRPDAIGREPTAHALAVSELTGVDVALPAGRPLSAAAQTVAAEGAVSFSRGAGHTLCLTFDFGRQGGVADLRPGLPLVLKW